MGSLRPEDLYEYYKQDATPSYRHRKLQLAAEEGLLSDDDLKILNNIIPNDEYDSDDKMLLRELFEKYFKPAEPKISGPSR